MQIERGYQIAISDFGILRKLRLLEKVIIRNMCLKEIPGKFLRVYKFGLRSMSKTSKLCQIVHHSTRLDGTRVFKLLCGYSGSKSNWHLNQTSTPLKKKNIYSVFQKQSKCKRTLVDGCVYKIASRYLGNGWFVSFLMPKKAIFTLFTRISAFFIF